MGGIILIIIVVFISVMTRKVAAVALQLTGLDKPKDSGCLGPGQKEDFGSGY